MSSEIRKIAAFLDIPIDETNWVAILEHCSFNYMKANGATTVPLGGALWEEGAKSFLHKGVNGRWREVLSTEESQKYEQMALEKLGAACAKWLATGDESCLAL